MALPVGSRFGPKDLGLVRLYLRNMVDRKQSSFMTTMDEPWLLPHVSNPLFHKKEWYYFVPRSKRGGQTPKRTVPGRGGSLGGFWKNSVKKVKILDGQNTLLGFKQSLTYYQKSEHLKDGLKTDWLMTESTLDKGREFQELVLCQIRDRKGTEDQKLGFFNHVPQPQPQVAETRETNNVVSNQLVQEDADFADELEAMMLQGEGRDDTQQQQQPQEEEEIQILPPPQSNDNNGVMMTTRQELHENEVKMLQGEDRDDTQQQQPQQEEEEIPILLPVQNNDNNGVMMAYPELCEFEAMLLQRGDGDDTQQKQQQEEEEEEILILPPLHISDFNIDVMMMSNHEQLDEWDWDSSDSELDKLFDMSDLRGEL